MIAAAFADALQSAGLDMPKSRIARIRGPATFCRRPVYETFLAF